MNHDTQRGKEIYQAILKAAYQALFSIGVKSPENVDKFILNLEANLGKEFLRIGVYQLEEPETSPSNVEETETPPTGEIEAGLDHVSYIDPVTITTSIDHLKLNNLTERRLKLAGVATIEDLVPYMSSGTLTTIKGIKEKSAAEIMGRYALWQSQS